MLLCCLVAEDEPGPVMFDKHVEKSLKGFVNYFIVLCLKSIQWAVCVNVGVQVFVRAANVCASGLWVITKAPQWRSSDILHSASPCCAFPFTPTESWQTLTSSYTHLISDRAINTSWPFTHRTTVWGTLHTTGASPRRPDHEHINPQSTHTHTYSEIWTKMSAPPSDGVINPWPLEREKYLHMPVNTGPSDARAVLHRKHITERWETWAQSRLMNQQRQIPRKTRHIWNKHFILKGRWLLTSRSNPASQDCCRATCTQRRAGPEWAFKNIYFEAGLIMLFNNQSSFARFTEYKLLFTSYRAKSERNTCANT